MTTKDDLTPLLPANWQAPTQKVIHTHLYKWSPLISANGDHCYLLHPSGNIVPAGTPPVTYSFAIFGWTYLTITWVARPRASTYVAIAAFWLPLTVVFEFVFARLVMKHSWEELLRPYRFEGGDIWPIILAVVAISPIIAARLRRQI